MLYLNTVTLASPIAALATPLLRPILLLIVNSALIPLRYYKITSLQHLLPLSTSMPILICLKYLLLLTHL
jgi:hypothetical protein